MSRSEPGSRPCLPLPMPLARASQIALIVMRKMVRHGLHDSSVVMLAMAQFGPDFRKPLVLMRALVVELAEASQRRIAIAPCCALGMTRDEGLLLDLVQGAGLAPYAALTDDAGDTAPLATAEALGAELEALALARGWRT